MIAHKLKSYVNSALAQCDVEANFFVCATLEPLLQRKINQRRIYMLPATDPGPK